MGGSFSPESCTNRLERHLDGQDFIEVDTERGQTPRILQSEASLLGYGYVV